MTVRLRHSILLVAFGAAVFLSLVGAGQAKVTAPPQSTPQGAVAERWAADMAGGDLSDACEIQAQRIPAQACAWLPSHSKPAACPAAFPGAKSPYRKSEVRSPAEQVGEFTAESPTRGFIRIKAEVIAEKLWGSLGLELVEGSWRTTYLRFGGETFAPAGTALQSEAWHKLWVSDWCPTNHPQWEKPKKK
jgi:hypothetical protein